MFHAASRVLSHMYPEYCPTPTSIAFSFLALRGFGHLAAVGTVGSERSYLEALHRMGHGPLPVLLGSI